MNPSSRAEAEKASYGRRYGSDTGRKYDPLKCAESVRNNGRWPSFHQCNRKPGFGPDGIFCKAHDPVAKKEREAKRDQKWDALCRAERPKRYAHDMLQLLKESQQVMPIDWRDRRDELIKKIEE